MAFIQRKKREEDDEIGIRQSEFAGLGMDLGLMVCPMCRREVPDWRETCEDCGKKPVPKAGLPPVTPDIPEHLVAPDPELEAFLSGELDDEDYDEEEDDVDEDIAAEEESHIEDVMGDQPQSKKGKRSWLRWI